MEPPQWLKSLREAMGGAIQGDDLKAIMAKQVEKAKEGDRSAADFVFGQAHKLLQSEQKRMTMVQNNYYDTPAAKRPDAPIEPDDDRETDIQKLRARAAARVPITGRESDRRVRPVSDEEEKEIRRREDAEE